MKKFVTILIIIFSLVSCGVFEIVTTPESQYEKEVEVSGTKQEIYVRSNEWMVKVFSAHNDAKSVIQFQDKEQGVIIGKYLLHPRGDDNILATADDIFAVIKIMVKDNRAKIIIESLGAWKYSYSQGFIVGDHSPEMPIAVNYSPEMAESDINNLIKNFNDFIIKKTNEW